MRTTLLILAMLMATLAVADDFHTLLHMELEALGPGEPGRVADHLGEDLLCLVIWDSQCPDCLENVAQLGEVEAPDGVRLLGVNFDDLPWDAEDFLAAREPDFPQLHDPEARFASALDADDFSFSFALLDGAGEIKAIHYDSVKDAPLTLRQAVEAIRGSAIDWKIKAADSESSGSIVVEIAEAPEGAKVVHTERRYPTFKHSGQLRTRGLSVSLAGEEPDCGCGVSGPYGENLQIQKNLLYRASYELQAELAKGVSAGAKLRVSNEDPIIFEQGPEYLGSEFGSVFAEIRRERLSARMGYFSDHFTPLTLQRWDFTDNPPAAGSGGTACGVCGATVRGVSLEALDDLGPAITFEGLRLESALTRRIRVTGFYAVPQRAVESNGSTLDNPFAYRLDVLGTRLRYSLPGEGEIAVQHLSAHEDGESSDLPPSWSELPLSFIHKSEVWSVSGKVPLGLGLQVFAETGRSFERVDMMNATGQSANGAAHLAELSYRPQKHLRLAAAYQKLEPEFASPFRPCPIGAMPRVSACRSTGRAIVSAFRSSTRPSSAWKTWKAPCPKRSS